jgi:CRP-like cAMP-binding protein
MHDTNAIPTENYLIRALRPADRARVERCLEPVDLPLGHTLSEAGVPMHHAYFPAAGVISLVNEMQEGTVEVGTVGREGMLGVPILLYADRTTTRAFMQVEGSGWRCTAEDLLACVREVPAFNRLLHRYMLALFEQVGQSAACNRLHSLEERCARWLLMVHDRVGDELLPLKQSFLADMLGVHRPAVTIAAGALQSAGLIRYSRGRVHILDRPGLEAAACPCYRIVRESFERLRDGA